MLSFKYDHLVSWQAGWGWDGVVLVICSACLCSVLLKPGLKQHFLQGPAHKLIIRMHSPLCGKMSCNCNVCMQEHIYASNMFKQLLYIYHKHIYEGKHTTMQQGTRPKVCSLHPSNPMHQDFPVKHMPLCASHDPQICSHP